MRIGAEQWVVVVCCRIHPGTVKRGSSEQLLKCAFQAPQGLSSSRGGVFGEAEARVLSVERNFYHQLKHHCLFPNIYFTPTYRVLCYITEFFLSTFVFSVKEKVEGSNRKVERIVQ